LSSISPISTPVVTQPASGSQVPDTVTGGGAVANFSGSQVPDTAPVSPPPPPPPPPPALNTSGSLGTTINLVV